MKVNNAYVNWMNWIFIIMLTLPLIMLFFYYRLYCLMLKNCTSFLLVIIFLFWKFLILMSIFYNLKVVLCKEHIAEFGYKVKKLCSIRTLNSISIFIVLTGGLFLPSYFMLLFISVTMCFPFYSYFIASSGLSILFFSFFFSWAI